jgi:hypothetical protein
MSGSKSCDGCTRCSILLTPEQSCIDRQPAWRSRIDGLWTEASNDGGLTLSILGRLLCSTIPTGTFSMFYILATESRARNASSTGYGIVQPCCCSHQTSIWGVRYPPTTDVATPLEQCPTKIRFQQNISSVLLDFLSRQTFYTFFVRSSLVSKHTIQLIYHPVRARLQDIGTCYSTWSHYIHYLTRSMHNAHLQFLGTRRRQRGRLLSLSRSAYVVCA